VFRLPVWQSLQQQAIITRRARHGRLRPVLRAVRKLRDRAEARRRILSAHPAGDQGPPAHGSAGGAGVPAAGLGHVVLDSRHADFTGERDSRRVVRGPVCAAADSAATVAVSSRRSGWPFSTDSPLPGRCRSPCCCIWWCHLAAASTARRSSA
jgi:hypothetical protein